MTRADKNKNENIDARRSVERFRELKTLEKQWQDETGYELIEQSYNNKGSRLIYYSQFYRLIEKMKAADGARILEVGCGGGHFIKLAYDKFKSKNALCVGLDISVNLTRVERNNNKRLFWVVADGEILPFGDDTFDIIIFNGSLHHMPDFTRAFTEAFRVIRKNGQILLQEPASTLFSRTVHHLLDPLVFKKVKYESPVDEFCKDSFRPQLLRKTITDAGYTFEESWHDFLAYPLTGCYANSYFSKRPGLLLRILKIEKTLQKMFFFKVICRFFSWRILIEIEMK